MKINTNSWHYRLWKDSYDDPYRVPHEIDLCRYYHRVFWSVVGRILLIALGTMVLVGMLWGLYVIFFENYRLTMTIIGISVALLILPLSYVWWLNHMSKPKKPKTLVGKWFQARKQQVCPMVDFTSEDE